MSWARRGSATISPGSLIIGASVILATGLLIANIESKVLFYIAGAPVILMALVDFEWNLGLMFLALHFAATRKTWMLEYSNDGRWVVLFMLAIKFLMPLRKKGKETNIALIQIGFGAFCAMATFSSFHSLNFRTSLYRSISLWFMYFAVFLSLWRYMDSREKIERMIRIFAYIAFGMVIGTFINHQTDGKGAEFWGRLKGYYVNPNTLGLMLTMQIPFALWIFTTPKFNVGFWRTLHFLMLISAIVALVMSGSRAALVGVLVGVAAYIALRYRSRLLFYATIGMMLGGITYGLLSDVVRTKYFQDVVYRKDTLDEGSGRIRLWKLAWQLSKRTPWIGYGFGTSEIVLWAQGDYLKIGSADPQGIHAHNTFLRLLLEMGTVGVIFGVIFLASFSRCIALLIRASPTNELFNLVIALFATLLAGMFDSVFESWGLSVGCILAVPYWTCVMLMYRMNFHIEDFVNADDTERPHGIIFTASRYGK